MTDQTPWHAAFPAPETTAPLLSRTAALPLVASGDPSLLLIDVRRTDYEGGAIRSSLNLPAQSFFANRRALYALCHRAGVRTVAFYCGSSNGRGPRCAGWFADVVQEEKGGEGLIQAMTLEGGIKGWIAAGREYTDLVDGYDEKCWRQI